MGYSPWGRKELDTSECHHRPSPLITISLFAMTVDPFLFCEEVYLYLFFFQIPHISDIIGYLSFSGKTLI